MLDTPFSPWPSFSDEEAEAVKKVLLSNKVNYWTGSEGSLFEEEFSDFSGCAHSIALANGTAALELALYALDIGAGDEVIVTPRTFIASVSAIVMRGATPVFAEVDASSQNITAETVKAAVTPDTKAIIAVHLAGWPCEMDEIMQLADQHGLYVIEDCAQAHGARYKGQSVGSIGHIGCWSFCQDKIITTGGEGGMVTTNDKALWSKMWSYKDHGKSWKAVYENKHSNGFKWLHDSFGTNWRLTEMQAAIGRIQLQKMPAWHQKRTANANAILDACSEFETFFTAPRPPQNIEHAWYKCSIFIRPEQLSEDFTRDKIIEEFEHRGIPCSQGSCSEIYLEKAFDDTPYRPLERFAVARELGDNSIMFLVHPTLTDSEINQTCEAIRAVGLLLKASGVRQRSYA